MNNAPTQRTRTYSWADQRMDLEEVKKLSGLDFLRALLDGRFPRPSISDTFDFTLTEVEHGRAVFEGSPGEFVYNPLGTVHGGYAATLLDSAMGCAVHTTMPVGMSYTTVELKVNYVRPMRAGIGKVRCEAKVVHSGGRIATADGRLTGPDGKLIAHGSTTCLVFPI